MTVQQEIERAIELLQRGQTADAQAACRRILAKEPDQPDALHLLGLIAVEAGRPNTAVNLIRRAIAINPVAAEYHFNLGQVFSMQGMLDDAIAATRQGLALQPDRADGHSSLGIKLRAKGRTDEAIASFRRALAIQPDHPLANNNLGNMLAELGRMDEAIECYRKAIAAMPDFPLPYNNLGAALRARGDLDEAVELLRKASALDPNYAEAWNNLGNAHKDLGELDQAIDCYRRAMSLNPREASFHDNLVFVMLYHPACDQESIHAEARRWNECHAEPLSKSVRPHNNVRNGQRRLRVGYVSFDFRDHAVARFLLPLLRNHDHRHFEVICYSNVAAPDAMTKLMSELADLWRPIAHVTDDDAATLIRGDAIDILVDLSGHTAGNRLLVLARKPAPIQVTWLGYPDTTGMTAIDYRITDAVADPPGLTERHNVEQLIRLPKTAWCFEPASTAAIDSAASQRDRPFTFGCFNYFGKVTEHILRLWGRILWQAPASRLLLKSAGLGSVAAQRRVKEVLAASGISCDRLLLRGQDRSYEGHMARYTEMDIALDTFPYNGTTTTCEALWTAVPVVTLSGLTHYSRVSRSLLGNVGLHELVADNDDEYVQIAVNLANDRRRLSEMHATLRQRLLASPLMDAAAFARAMEAAYRSMWQKWCQAQGD